jgi:ABC-type dipeptide/oligopeptide/nickel transport system permease component
LSVQGAIRSLLGIALTLVAVSVGLFWACATYDSRTRTTRSSPFAELPLFFNRHPVGVRERAADAVRAVARGGPAARPAAAELAMLGGAALPYVLPALDSLDPDSRVRVALALTPVAVRMEVASADDLVNGDQAVLFWTRFWQDRAIDFRAPAVRHLTTRLAERSIALRREDLIHVDTFALPALIDALGEVRTEDDTARVRRLSSVLSHVTGAFAPLPPEADIAQARRSAEAWRDFWELHGNEYSALDGPRRLTATFAETQYGKWLADVLRGGLGRTRAGETALSLVESGLPTTLLLLLIGLGGGFSLAVAWARFERRTGTLAARYASALLGTALAAIPCATFVRLLSGSPAGYASAAGVVMLTTAAWVSRHLARSTLTPGHVSPLASAFSVSAPLGATYPPFVLSAIVLVELAFQLPGLGGMAARALRTGDVNAWMAASLALALATLLLRQLAELLRPRLTARHAASPS